MAGPEAVREQLPREHPGREHRSRPVPVLALGQVRYQLLLMLRSPLGFFLTLVIPVLLLVVLDVLVPAGGSGPAGLPYGQFLTPAMSAFGLLNAAYVTVITGVVLAREEGVLKRLRGTPLPAWSYLAGRFGAVLVTVAVTVVVIVGLGAAFFSATVIWRNMGYFAAATALGVVAFYLLGVAVTTVVPKTDTALPVAFGTMLPLAFVSDVFFSVSSPPGWLYDLASAFPVAPVVRAMEDSFSPATHSWPMPVSGLAVVLAWCAVSAAVIALTFRWEPGLGRLQLHWPGRPHR